MNGRFFVFKRIESRFGEKFPNTALFYCKKLSQSFWRFLVRYAESVESHHSRLVRHFCFPLYIYHPIERGTKGTVDHVDDAGTLHCTFDNGRTLGVVTDADIFHVIDRLNVPVAERYAYLLGSAIDGNKRLHNVQEVAEFICKHGQYGDVRITTMEGKELLDTFGIYINKISDMEYREELLKVLVPMQHEVENAAFSEDEDMDETEEVGISM